VFHRRAGVWSGNNILAVLAGGRAALVDKAHLVEIYVAAATEIVHRAVDLTILKVELSVGIAVISVLVRQHLHVLADGAVALVLQHHGTSCRTAGIIVERVFQREVLEIGVPAGDEECGRGAYSLVGHLGSVHDDSLVAVFAHDGDIVSGDGREHRLAEIIHALGQEDVSAGIACVGIGHGKGAQQVVGIAGPDHVVAGLVAGNGRVLHVDDGERVHVGCTVEDHCQFVGRTLIIVREQLSVGRCRRGDGRE